MSDSTRNQWQIVFDVCVKLSVPILLGVAGWTFTELTDHDRRLTTIEANRYTQRDARMDRDALVEQLRQVGLDVRELVTKQNAALSEIQEIKQGLRDGGSP